MPIHGSGDHHFFPRNPQAEYLIIRRAEGVYLYDETDRPILDGSSGAAVVCLGHGHPRVLERMRRQAGTVAFTHSFAFVTRPALELADRLARQAGDPSARVLFTSGGSEATETALKLARAYQLAAGRPDKHRVISRAISYHGSSIGALSMTGLLGRRQMYEPLLVAFPRAATAYCYRCPFGLDPERCAVECAADIERTILEHGAATIAAFIVEPVIGASAPGVGAPRDYMARVAETCRRHDVLLIADEVMSGTGRTGRFFAMEHYGVRPDITVLSKSLSSGYLPLAAVIVSGRVFEAIRTAGAPFVHGFTYAGNPLAAAVGLEVLDVLEDERLVEAAADKGARLLRGLDRLREHPMVGDVRGCGLLIGVEFVADRASRRPFLRQAGVADRVLRASLAEGLAIYPGTGAVDGLAGDHILIAPPYIISDAQIDELIEKLDRAIGKVQEES